MNELEFTVFSIPEDRYIEDATLRQDGVVIDKYGFPLYGVSVNFPFIDKFLESLYSGLVVQRRFL